MSSTPPPQPPPTPAYQPASPAAPQPRKTSPLVWIAVGCGGLLVVLVAALLVGGYFVARKAKEFVVDAEKNPALAAVKLAVAVNPELEIVETDEAGGVVTVRNKRTGEILSVDLTEAEHGRIRFRNEKGEEVTISGGEEGGKGTLKVESDTGTWTMGTGGDERIPAWVPRYPGAEIQGVMSSTSGPATEGGFSFSTADDVERVMKLYEEQLKAAGFSVTTNTFQQDGAVQGGMVNGTTTDRSRTCTVTASRGEDGTTVAVAFKEGGED